MSGPTDSLEGKNTLVTGGLGFIGSNLARRLVERGANVMLVDSLVPEYGGNLFNIAGIEDRVQVNISDVRDRFSLKHLVQGQDFIFNLAGQTSHLDSMEDPETDLAINCAAQLSILESCRRHNPGAKLVFASTRQIYGKPRYLPVNEEHPLDPVDVNGINKMAAESYHSRDNTIEICERAMLTAAIPVTLAKLSRNFGEHHAIMAGLRHASGDYVVTMDDDLQNPPSEVLKLVRHAREGGHEVDYSHYGEKKHSGWRNLGSRLTNRMATLLLDKPKGLYLSSFRCMSAFVAKQICRYDGPFAYVDGLILQVTNSMGRVLVAHAEREDGRSGYTLRKLVKLWLDTFVNFSVIPLHIATMLGFAMAVLGLVYAIVVICERLLNGTPLGWSSLMAALTVFSGTQLIVLGMAGEYIGRVHLTANKRPQFVVKEIVRGGSPPNASL